MSLLYNRIMDLLESNDTAALAADSLSAGMDDMVELGLLIGPRRLADIINRLHWTTDFVWGPSENSSINYTNTTSLLQSVRPPVFPMIGKEITVRTLQMVHLQAYPQDLHYLALRQSPMMAETTTILSTLAATIKRLKTAQVVRITRDVTNTLPNGRRTPSRMTEADFTAAATRLGVEVAAIKAVSSVESGGRSGFDELGRPKILFEGHYFRRLTGKKYDKSHPHLSYEYKDPNRKLYYKWDQYARLYEAMILDIEAAVGSASWGKFQVMGSNHNGWPNAIDFAVAMFDSEANQLKSFEAFCNDNNLVRFIKAKDWAGFARGYNGEDYKKDDYDGKMRRAYDAIPKPKSPVQPPVKISPPG